MKNRQYYKDTVTKKLFSTDFFIGDVNECLNFLSIFIEDFDENKFLYMSITNSETKDYELLAKFIPKNVEHNIFQYAVVKDIKEFIDISNHISYRMYDNYQDLSAFTGYKSKKKSVQKVFNITKEYVREQKLKRLLNES